MQKATAEMKSYTVQGRLFRRQADLDAAVKAALNSHPLDTEFTDDFLAAVINELHPSVRAAGQRATGRFKYLSWREQRRLGMDSAERYRGGKTLIGFFEPLGEWRDVTAYPSKKPADPRREVKLGLRELIAPHLPKKSPAARCAVAGCASSWLELEYEHRRPTFDEIAEGCLALMTEQEIATQFGYSKFVRGRDEWPALIPRSHPAHVVLLATHEHNEWVWLCRRHHRNVGAATTSSRSTTEQLTLALELP